jgi:putative ABC transport system substrate-binding protein
MAVSSEQKQQAARTRERMSERIFVLTLCALLFALCPSAEAQQAKKVPRIGYLSPTDPASDSTRSEAIRLALRELGYIEGQNITVEYRYAEGKSNRDPELAAELVRLKVDIIVVAGGDGPVRAARRFPSLWRVLAGRSCRVGPG